METEADIKDTPEDSAPEAAPLIRLENIVVAFEGRRVLDNINLDIHSGESLNVIGQSGCGKTVLLKVLMGMMPPTSGRSLFDGRDWSALREKEKARSRLRFGFLFQGAALFDSLSVYENVAFALREHTQMKEPQIREEVFQRLEEVGLPTGIEHQKPAELSGGMKKRVGLARAIAMGPEVMLYDEPTTGLDPVMSDVINDLIVKANHRENVTSIVVTHDMKTVRKTARRVVMLQPSGDTQPGEGQILFDGKLEELDRCEDNRVRQFVGL